MAKRRLQRTETQRTESVEAFKDSEFKIRDFEVKGLLSWFVVGGGLFVIIFFMILFRDPISAVIKKIFRRKK